MKKEIFEKLLKDNGVELTEEVKFEEIWNGVDTAIGGAIKNTRETTLEKMTKEAQDIARDEYIKSLGIEGVENDNQFKAHISSLQANEDGQELIKTRQELEALKGEYDTYKTDAEGYKSKLSQYENEKFVLSKNPNVDVDYLTFKINKYDGETFEEKYNTFVADETNKKYFEPIAPVTQSNTGVVRQPNTSTGELEGWEQILVEQGKLKI